MALRPSQDARKRSAEIVVHNTVPGEEARYDLPMSGKSGGSVGSRLFGASGRNYPAVRLPTANMVLSLCTSSAAYGREASGLGSPDSTQTRDELPRESLVRSNEKSLSVLESSQTIYESLYDGSGVMSGPALIDHLKSDIPHTGSNFRARGDWNRGVNGGATSGSPSKDGVFSLPTVANYTLNGNENGNGVNTRMKVQHYE